MLCKLCRERGKTWEGDDPKCAFEYEHFNTANWNCATMSKLRSIANVLGTVMRDDDACASIGYVPLSNDYWNPPNESYPSEMSAGYIVMTWYKDRGRTGQALVMWDAEPPRTLTEYEALEAIRCYEMFKDNPYSIYSTQQEA